MSMKINSLQFENVKRIKAVQMKPSESGLTIIGGNNEQGKTSVLDAIAWALGGEKYRPSEAQREGSTLPLCTLAARSESEATISFWISEGCTTTVSNFASGTGRSS